MKKLHEVLNDLPLGRDKRLHGMCIAGVLNMTGLEANPALSVDRRVEREAVTEVSLMCLWIVRRLSLSLLSLHRMHVNFNHITFGKSGGGASAAD